MMKEISVLISPRFRKQLRLSDWVALAPFELGTAAVRCPPSESSGGVVNECASSFRPLLGGLVMVILIDALFGLSSALFVCLILAAKNWRRVLALTLAGMLVVALVSPPPAQAQASLVSAIEAVLNVINGVIQTTLNKINSVRSAMQQLYEGAVWPASLIGQARAFVAQMVGQYRTLMHSIFGMSLKSATLANPIALENVIRNHQTNDFSGLTTAFGKTFGGVPAATAASPADRSMMDMDDALAMDNLKMLKESDAADDLAVQAASDIEDQASQAAPGSAPFITATAVAASIQSQALTQRMLAAELRQEAARLAHQNALRKRGATITRDVSGQILNLLKRH